MRHFLTAGAVASLAGGVPKPAGATVLIAPAGTPDGDAPGAPGAFPRAVALPPITPAAQEEELPAVRSDADDQPQRVHALPRSGRGGWTSTLRCAKKGAAIVALPRVMPPEGPGCRDSGPSPSAPSRERSTSTHHARQPARRQPVVNSALFGDRQHQAPRHPSRGAGGRPARRWPQRNARRCWRCCMTSRSSICRRRRSGRSCSMPATCRPARFGRCIACSPPIRKCASGVTNFATRCIRSRNCWPGSQSGLEPGHHQTPGAGEVDVLRIERAARGQHRAHREPPSLAESGFQPPPSQ